MDAKENTHRTQGTNFIAKCLRILVNCQKLKKFKQLHIIRKATEP